MQENDIPRMCLPNAGWFPKVFLITQWYIYSTERNERGRTPFIMYHISGREVSVFNGECLDSESDYQGIARMNNAMAKFSQESKYKQAMSELEAKKIWIV